MDVISQELARRHEFDAAWLTPDPAAVLAQAQPLARRWSLWAHGAAALTSRHWRKGDPWLGACLHIAKERDNSGDTLWLAESLAALAELSFKDGEYLDALNRAGKGFHLWRQICQALDEVKPRKRGKSDNEQFAVKYVDGEISAMIQAKGGDWSAVGNHAQALSEHGVNMVLTCTRIALQSMSVARAIDPDFAAEASAFLDEHGDRLPLRQRYQLYMSMGDAASLTGAAQQALRWFDLAVDCYYQKCMDENDLQRLVRALFNKANALVRLGQHDEGIGIYRMIAGDFERFGDDEGELRVDYAIAHARYLKGDRDGLEKELRRIIAGYHDLTEAAEAGYTRVDTRNLPVVCNLLLTVLASAPSSRERFLEALGITNRSYREPPHLIVERALAIQRKGFSSWRSVQRVELLEAVLREDTDTITLMFESGADSLVLLAIRGETHEERCLVECMSQAFIDVITALIRAVDDENARITERRKTEIDPIAESVKHFGAAAWQALPALVKEWIDAATCLQVVLSPFGSIDEFPIELLLRDEGWLGLTHGIARYNSFDELFNVRCGDRPRRETKATALVDLAGTPVGMGELDHANAEACEVADYARFLGMSVGAPVTLDPEGLLEELKRGHHLLHYVGHGRATPLGERWMLTEDRWMPAAWLGSLDQWRTPIVFLSACDLGQSRLAGDRDKGVVVEFLRAGAPAVIAATRPVSDRASGSMVREIYAASDGGTPLGETMRRAHRAADDAGINPVCWSSFLLYGNPRGTLQPIESAEPSVPWHGLLMRYAATGDSTYLSEAGDAIRSAQLNPSAIETLQVAISRPLERLDDAVIGEVAQSDLIAGLRLRIFLSAVRIDASLAAGGSPRQDLLLEDVGTGLTLALRLNDDIGVVAMARRHCRLVGTVALHEVLRVLQHASPLASTLARQNPRFAKVAEELDTESALYAGKQIIDFTKVMPGVE